MLQANANTMGIGAVLQQGGQLVAYASRVLTPPENSYSVIQQECLAIVYALKQFRHYPELNITVGHRSKSGQVNHMTGSN